ncbi:hypothetical protein BASA81_001764 [Batrachochytrium salamandrivorans]|nr:hypothetical protein BASA81_001764 [Batrachochytrium salamandrivorans]
MLQRVGHMVVGVFDGGAVVLDNPHLFREAMRGKPMAVVGPEQLLVQISFGRDPTFAIQGGTNGNEFSIPFAEEEICKLWASSRLVCLVGKRGGAVWWELIESKIVSSVDPQKEGGVTWLGWLEDGLGGVAAVRKHGDRWVWHGQVVEESEAWFSCGGGPEDALGVRFREGNTCAVILCETSLQIWAQTQGVEFLLQRIEVTGNSLTSFDCAWNGLGFDWVYAFGNELVCWSHSQSTNSNGKVLLTIDGDRICDVMVVGNNAVVVLTGRGQVRSVPLDATDVAVVAVETEDVGSTGLDLVKAAVENRIGKLHAQAQLKQTQFTQTKQVVDAWEQHVLAGGEEMEFPGTWRNIVDGTVMPCLPKRHKPTATATTVAAAVTVDGVWFHGPTACVATSVCCPDGFPAHASLFLVPRLGRSLSGKQRMMAQCRIMAWTELDLSHFGPFVLDLVVSSATVMVVATVTIPPQQLLGLTWVRLLPTQREEKPPFDLFDEGDCIEVVVDGNQTQTLAAASPARIQALIGELESQGHRVERSLAPQLASARRLLDALKRGNLEGDQEAAELLDQVFL